MPSNSTSEIVGCFVLLCMGIVFHIIHEDNPVAMFSSFVKSFKWVATKLWLWPVVGIVAVALFGAGVNAMYSDGYIAAAAFYSVGVLLLCAKAITWEEARGHEHSGGIAVIVLLLGATILAAFLFWVRHTHAQLAKKNQPEIRIGRQHDEGVHLAENSTRNDTAESKVPLAVPRTPSTEQPPIERTAKFSVMLPFDTSPSSAPIPRDENPNDPLDQTYTELGTLVQWGTIPDSARETKETGPITWNANPVTMNDAPVFFGRVLQFYIFSCIDSLQHDSLTQFVGLPAKAQAGIEPPDAELYSDKKLSEMLANSRFFRPFLYRRNPGGIARMKLPKGTEVKFREERTAPNPPERFIVRYERPKYFKLSFEVHPFSGTGVGSVPRNFVTSKLSSTMQWTFFVTMRYSVAHPNDATFVPDTYAKWMDALYEGVSGKFAISNQ
jgi:hypothetical protein